jgi:2-hydroxychromene-2-carboxylate isomerase
MMAAVEFYFDYSCPWTYLACTRLREAALRTGSEIVWKPVFLAQVMAAVDPDHGDRRLDPAPRRADYQLKDLEDWARFCGLQMTLPSGWPHAVEAAACGAVEADRQQRITSYSDGVFAAYFRDGRDIGAVDTVCDVGAAAGLDPSRLEQAVKDPATSNVVRANSAELVQRGGFGSATMFVEDSMFFGSERIPLVEFALGQASGRDFVIPGQHA